MEVHVKVTTLQMVIWNYLDGQIAVVTTKVVEETKEIFTRAKDEAAEELKVGIIVAGIENDEQD